MSDAWNAWFHATVCKSMGLPPFISRADLCYAQRELARKKACKGEGIHHASTWKDIARKRSHDALLTASQARNLPAASTWDDVLVHDCKKHNAVLQAE